MTNFVPGKTIHNAGEKPFCEMCKKKGKDVLMEAAEFGSHGSKPPMKEFWKCPECKHQIDIN